MPAIGGNGVPRQPHGEPSGYSVMVYDSVH